MLVTGRAEPALAADGIAAAAAFPDVPDGAGVGFGAAGLPLDAGCDEKGDLAEVGLGWEGDGTGGGGLLVLMYVPGPHALRWVWKWHFGSAQAGPFPIRPLQGRADIQQQ